MLRGSQNGAWRTANTSTDDMDKKEEFDAMYGEGHFVNITLHPRGGLWFWTRSSGTNSG